MVIETLLADDEVLARLKLRQLLSAEHDIRIVGEGSSASETIELVRATTPRLMFLDIRMPGMDGFDLLGNLSASPGITVPKVIFTTAYDEYALRAFEIHALDYLLKPFTVERLRSAVQRAREQLHKPDVGPAREDGNKQNGNPYTARIVLKSRGRILFLPVSDICWIGAEENYVRVCTGKETHLLRQTLTGLEQKLDPHMFMRVHRSAIVNLHFVKEVRTVSQGDFIVQLVNGQKVAMSRSYHSRIDGMLAGR
jgi:two-component system, LytTR family, response regulator